jgi:hypothetical protein
MFIIFVFIVIAISRMNIFINAFINLSLHDDNYAVLEENL